MVKNRNLLIIALIAIVNALGYGIIIPILYSYSQKFGLSDFQNGLLFSVFSICQFISTPIIGRMSDKFGRKPLLLISLAGTAASFFLAAFAPSAVFLFLARALDGITAGNIPVASAVISDSTDPKDRARGFGVISGAFGFGFVFGPAISGLTIRFGESVPFIIAGIISTISVLVTLLFLPETNRHMGEIKKGKIFDLKKMTTALFDQYVGLTLLISLLYSVAFGVYIFGFQPFAVKSMHLAANQIAMIFSMLGTVGLIIQIWILGRLARKFGERKLLLAGFFFMVTCFVGLFFTHVVPFFILFVFLGAVGNSLINPMVQTVLSKETDDKSQGSIMGLNASYISIGMTVGPLIGGLLATYSISYPFLASAAASFASLVLSFSIKQRFVHKDTAF